MVGGKYGARILCPPDAAANRPHLSRAVRILERQLSVSHPFGGELCSHHLLPHRKCGRGRWRYERPVSPPRCPSKGAHLSPTPLCGAPRVRAAGLFADCLRVTRGKGRPRNAFLKRITRKDVMTLYNHFLSFIHSFPDVVHREGRYRVFTDLEVLINRRFGQHLRLA